MGGISGVGEHYNNADLTITIILAHCTYSCTQKSDHYTVRTTTKKGKILTVYSSFKMPPFHYDPDFEKGRESKLMPDFSSHFCCFRWNLAFCKFPLHPPSWNLPFWIWKYKTQIPLDLMQTSIFFLCWQPSMFVWDKKVLWAFVCTWFWFVILKRAANW